MNCAKCRKLIIEKFSGGISSESAKELDQHLSVCTECGKFHEENLAFTKAIRGLDSGSVRNQSIDAFSRLALSVRSYREPKPIFHGVFQLSGVRAATVAAAMLIVLLGLSNLNYSYSYTNGASMEISFNPPLEKSDSIDTDEFYNKINAVIGDALDGSRDSKRVSWACTMKNDFLEKIAIDVQTSDPVEITNVYDTLIDKNPAFAKGSISISPLREPVNAPFYKYVISRKRDIISESQIRQTVNTDLLNYVEKTKGQVLSLDKRTGKVRETIEAEFPAIRKIISDAYDKLKSSGGAKILTAKIKGGAQVDEIANAGFDPGKYIRDEITKLLEDRIKQDNLNLSSILHVDFKGPMTRITVGETVNGLFSPYSVGGWGVTIIRNSSGGIELDNIGEVIKPKELENLLNGILSPDILTSMVQERIKARMVVGRDRNETTIIEVWNGEKKAEITIDPDDPDSVQIEFPIIDENGLTSRSPENAYDKSESSSFSQKTEREFILRNPDISTDNKSREVMPPSFSNETNLLPDFVLIEDITQLVDGRITPRQLEQVISERIKAMDLSPVDQNIYLVRDGFAVTIRIVRGKVLIDVGESVGKSSSHNSVIVKFKDEEKRDESSSDGN